MFEGDLRPPVHPLVYLHNILLHIRHEMHCLRASFGDKLLPRFLYRESQTLGVCMAHNIHHSFVAVHRHRLLESQEDELPNRESEEYLQKGILWIVHIFAPDITCLLYHPNSHHQIRDDQHSYFNRCVSLDARHCVDHLLSELLTSRTLGENDERNPFLDRLVERLPR
ncbi:uncharacterized protein LOC114517068 [Dendronephthya gigantea]|uniref:uncharacterized protein LOC114517068 n=1 Tax=Dendronephthya gigantea TaxID=151771 RepID=UPI00106CA9C4|nr:uncharacterized protein LOC114517068 [Dendronephthya gigantea]